MPRLPAFVRLLVPVVAGVALALAVPPMAVAQPRLPGTPVPKGFVGVNVDGPMVTPQDNVALAPQFKAMVADGVESVRTTFDWSGAQPYASWSGVPSGQVGGFQSGAGGVPTSFAQTDQLVELADARGLSVLPVVIGAPSWDQSPVHPTVFAAPATFQPYADYLTTLVQRYGPNGSFWSQHPELVKRPIRMWEIWNEPDLSTFWPNQPFAPSYVALLSAAHQAIKQADSGARVVLGGLTNYAWEELPSIYRQPGARGLFDIVDVHPFTKQPAGVIEILSKVRAAMRRAGDGSKPLIAAEVSWPSSLHQTNHVYDFETTPAGQARNIGTVLPLLAANRSRLRLMSFYLYTWMGDEFRGADPFSFAGLIAWRSGRVSAKPALKTFRQGALALERCRRKGRLATSCAARG